MSAGCSITLIRSSRLHYDWIGPIVLIFWSTHQVQPRASPVPQATSNVLSICKKMSGCKVYQGSELLHKNDSGLLSRERSKRAYQPSLWKKWTSLGHLFLGQPIDAKSSVCMTSQRGYTASFLANADLPEPPYPSTDTKSTISESTLSHTPRSLSLQP